MVYRKPHLHCSENNCQSYSAYIKVQKKWIKAGEYNSKSKSFTPNDDVRTFDKILEERQKDTIQRLNREIPDELKILWGLDFKDVDT